MKALLLVATIVAVGAFAASNALALEPMWELDIACEHPQFVTVHSPAGDEAYWYIIYTVRNQLNEPKTIRPRVTMTDNMGHVLTDRYEPAVLDQVRRRTGVELKNVSNNSATLQPGEKMKAVAVFEMPDREASKLVVRFYGLANKRVQTEGGVAGIASRAYIVRFNINGDRYNFTPNRLETEWKGYVSTFRPLGEEGKTLDQAPDAEPMKLDEATEETMVVPAVGAVDEPADPLALLPEGLKGLGYIDLKQLTRTSLFREILKDAPRQMLEEMKLDPERDLSALAIGFADFAGEQPEGAIVITGTFDQGLGRRLQDVGEKVSYGGYDLYRKADDNSLIGLLDGRTIVLGSDATVRRVVDIHTGKAPAGKNAALLERAGNVRNSTAWFTADVELPAMPEQGAMMFPGLDPTKVNSITIGLNVVDEGCALTAVAGCSDEDTAAAATQGMKNGVNMLGMMAGGMLGQDADAMQAAQKFLQSIKINSEGATAILKLNVSRELLDALKAAGAKVQVGPAGDNSDKEIEDLDF